MKMWDFDDLLCYDLSGDGGELEDEELEDEDEELEDEDEELEDEDEELEDEEVILSPEFEAALEEYDDALDDEDEDADEKTSNPSFENVLNLVVNYDEALELVRYTPGESEQEKRAYEKLISLAPSVEVIDDLFDDDTWGTIASHDLNDACNKRYAELETQQK